MNSTLTVTTDAAETKLTTLDRVKLELSIADDTTDELLDAKIDEATSDIAVRCGPSLKREGLTETFYPDLPRGGRWGCIERIILKRWPVSSVDSVTLDGTSLDASGYRIDGDSGLLYRLSSDGYPSDWRFCKALAVVYSAGYLLPGQDGRNLPASLEAAAVELVASYWASRGRDPMLKSETNFGVAEFQYWVGPVGAAGDLPPGVMAKIGPFLRERII